MVTNGHPEHESLVQQLVKSPEHIRLLLQKNREERRILEKALRLAISLHKKETNSSEEQPTTVDA